MTEEQSGSLRFAEEIMLLLLDDQSGRFEHTTGGTTRYALSGAVLMDLALLNRIDTDLQELILLDGTPLQDPMFDRTLAAIQHAGQRHDARYWVERIGDFSDDIRECALDRLVERGILERREDRFLWVFRSRRYPLIGGKAAQSREVKQRIMGVLFSDEIPEPRDIVIICLANACGIFKKLLSPRELERASERIQQVRKLDLIGQAVSTAIWEIETSLAMAIIPYM